MFLVRFHWMIQWLMVAIFSVAASAAVPVQDSQKEPSLKVRLQAEQSAMDVEGVSLQFHENGTAFPVGAPSRKEISKISVTEEGFAVEIAGPLKNYKKNYKTKELFIQGEALHSNHHPLPNQVMLIKTQKGFDVIGLVDLEQYIAGVVASEMPANFPMETLKAQAIAARSYALAIRKERANQRFHLENTIMDQVFEPWKQKPEHLKNATKAVMATKGMLLQDEKSQPIKAFYHSHCGGETAKASDVWGGGRSYGTVKGDLCQLKYPKTWSYEIGVDEIGQKLLSQLQKSMKKQFEFFDLVPVRKGFRVFSLEMRSEKGLAERFLAQELRQALGFKVLKSTSFEVKKENQKMVFLGRGFGHGVGLCQWGSRAYAEEGKDYRYILSHYYPQAVLN